MNNAPTIGVVTITYNSESVLPEFLKSVFSQTFREFRLYVIDNCSKDDSLKIVDSYPDPRVSTIRNSVNVGVAEGNNQGICAALSDGCEYVLLLNNDTVFCPGLFDELYQGLQKFNCDMTTGKMYYYDRPDRIWCAGGWLDPGTLFNAFHYGMGETDSGQFGEARSVTYTPTCCLLIHRSVFDRIGFMDVDYFVYGDDVDFLYRCFLHGLSLWYVPTAQLYHKVSSLTGGDTSEFAIRYMTRNRMYFLRKHLSIWKALLWATHFMVATAPFRLLRGKDSLRLWRLRCGALLEGWALHTRQSTSRV